MSTNSNGYAPPLDPALRSHISDHDRLRDEVRAYADSIPQAFAEFQARANAQEAKAPSADPPKNRGGAPLGNQNARKHGYYSKSLPPKDQALFNEMQLISHNDLEEEITLMRVKLHNLFASPNPPEELIIKTVRAIAYLTYLQNQMRS
ncbi:MAG: hypothetical protein FJ320_03480 [SAR202 cluster bacterium]|nr:hypothetical protein [SAR202 cluster bacterium]